MDVADGLGVFMFMHAILPQEWLQVLIDNTVDTIDFLDGHALHRQTMRLEEQGAEAVAICAPSLIGCIEAPGWRTCQGGR